MRVHRLWPWCAVFMLVAEATAASPPPHGMIVQLDFAANDSFSPAVTRAAVEEAATIWRPYGVTVTAASSEPCSPEAAVHVRLSVVSAAHVVERVSGQNALAAVRFDGEGNPLPRIEVYVAPLRAMIRTVVWLGIPPERWPSAWWQEISGRVLGRVLAHEIGHYVLRLRGHDSYGLMAPVHQMRDFADPSSTAFKLSRWNVRRLASVALPSPIAANP